MIRISLIATLAVLAVTPGVHAQRPTCCGPFENPGELALSPDGRYAYVSDYLGTLTLRRDPSDGSLTFIQAIDGGGTTTVMSADGKNLYVGGRFPYPNLHVFKRDGDSGRLEHIQKLSIPEQPESIDMALSGDGHQLYVTTRGVVPPQNYPVGGLAILDRAADGRLTHRVTIMREADPNPDGKRWHPNGLVLGPAGNNLYVADSFDTEIDRFTRDANGDLTYAEAHRAGGFWGPFDSVAISADGGRVYHGPTQLAVFNPDASGALSLLGRPPDFQNGGFGGDPRPTALLATADSGTVYAMQEGYLLQGTPTADGLALERTYRDRVDGVAGLTKARAIHLSPDGKNLYVPSSPDPYGQPGAVSVFSRNTETGDLTFLEYFRGPTFSSYQPNPSATVVVNGGAAYTRDPNVVVRIWPQTSISQIRLANDGGFSGAVTVPPGAANGEYRWTLARSGPELQPKTVYAMVTELGTTRIITDSILLDERPPEIVTLRLRGSRLRVTAHDTVSGVKAIQIKPRRRRARPWRTYEERARYRVSAQSARVRVSDRAGNVSPWRKARR